MTSQESFVPLISIAPVRAMNLGAICGSPLTNQCTYLSMAARATLVPTFFLMVYNGKLAMGMIPLYFGPSSNHATSVVLMIICRRLYVKDYFINSGWDLDFLSLYLPQEIIRNQM